MGYEKMKKIVVVALMVILALQMAACGKTGAGDKEIPVPVKESKSVEKTSEDILKGKIIKGSGTDTLVIAGENASDMLIVHPENAEITIDGKKAKAEDLKDGMVVELDLSKGVATSYPGQVYNPGFIKAVSKGEGVNNLPGLYIKALEDLWNKDKGLNDNIELISVDIAMAGDLTAGEKAAIAWIFGDMHEVEAVNYSREKLEKDGYIKNGAWEDGVLFEIKPEKDVQVKDGEICFDIQKWRSGTGAFYLENCIAKVPMIGEKPEYKVGSEAIS